MGPKITVIEGGLSKTRGPILPIGVTAKEDAFARAVVLDGKSLSDAYRASHHADTMAPATVWRKASLVAARGRVRARMDALRAEKDRQTCDDAEVTRRYVIERLMHESLHALQASARIRALELLGKLDFVGMFRERREVEVADERSSEEIEAELLCRLKALVGAN